MDQRTSTNTEARVLEQSQSVVDAWAARDAIVAERKAWLVARSCSERATIPMNDEERDRVLAWIEAETAAIQQASKIELRAIAEKTRVLSGELGELADEKRAVGEAIARRDAYIEDCANLGCQLFERIRSVVPPDAAFHSRDGQRTFDVTELSAQGMREVCFAAFTEAQTFDGKLAVRIARAIARALKMTLAELAQRHTPEWARIKLVGADTSQLSDLILEHFDLELYDLQQALRVSISIADALKAQPKDLH